MVVQVESRAWSNMGVPAGGQPLSPCVSVAVTAMVLAVRGAGRGHGHIRLKVVDVVNGHNMPHSLCRGDELGALRMGGMALRK